LNKKIKKAESFEMHHTKVVISEKFHHKKSQWRLIVFIKDIALLFP